MTLGKTPFALVSVFVLPLALTACGRDKTSEPKDRPDLRMISVAFDPPNPVAGQTVGVTAVVKSVGIVGAPATMTGVTVDGTQICSEIPTPALPIDSTATVTCNLGAPPAGIHGVGVCADVTNEADESDEMNNCILRNLEVAAGIR